VAISAIFEPGVRSTVASASAGRRNPSRARKQDGNPARNRRNPIAELMRPASRIGGAGDSARFPVSPPGVIGAAVIKAARCSAGLTQRRLARMLAVRPAVVRAWETGTTPLFCVDYSEICQLANVLRRAGAQAGTDTAELVLASQCDLLVTGMLDGFEDYAEVPPIDESSSAAEAARQLLRWALAGEVPARYSRYTSPGSLLKDADIPSFAFLAQELQGGSRGHELTSYGTVLISLTEP
jgi:DNA-binding XRE family transcriptional regulator